VDIIFPIEVARNAIESQVRQSANAANVPMEIFVHVAENDPSSLLSGDSAKYV
jgi:hypothetical protein